MQLPVHILAPMFFADPAGAIVGKAASRLVPRINSRWWGEKTVCGSAAVYALTFATILYPCTLSQRAAIACAAALAEAVGGAYDNLALAAVVLLGWMWTTSSEQ